MGKTNTAVPPRDFFKRASDVASYYGFQPIETALAREKRGGSVRLKSGDRSSVASLCFPAGSKLSEPLFFYYVNEHPKCMSPYDDSQAELNLEIAGTGKSVAEAILIKTALSIFEENGVTDTNVVVNGIGDKDCIARFGRDLTTFYRKRVSDLHAQCRNNLSKDVFKLLQCGNEHCRAMAGDAPRPMNYLTESSRTHFREVLEYLESLSIPYVVEDSLLGSRESFSKVVFQIRQSRTDTMQEDEAERILASGGRYDDMARRVTSRKDATGVGISILFPRHAYRSLPKKDVKKETAKAYFVHIGFEAKMKSLAVLDLLRKAHISVHQSLHHDQLSGQLSSAARLGSPYLLIMGQKEAKEGTVIVRDVETREQDIVPIGRLSLHLRSMAH